MAGNARLTKKHCHASKGGYTPVQQDTCAKNGIQYPSDSQVIKFSLRLNSTECGIYHAHTR